MEDFFSRVWNNLGARVTGPLSFRLLLQPTMAIIFAVRDGLKDAKTGQPPYFWSVFTNERQRRALLSEGWRAILKVFVLAIILDSVFQFVVFRWIYPGEAALVAFLLAFVPYLLARGPVNRIARRVKSREKARVSNFP